MVGLAGGLYALLAAGDLAAERLVRGWSPGGHVCYPRLWGRHRLAAAPDNCLAGLKLACPQAGALVRRRGWPHGVVALNFTRRCLTASIPGCWDPLSMGLLHEKAELCKCMWLAFRLHPLLQGGTAPPEGMEQAIMSSMDFVLLGITGLTQVDNCVARAVVGTLLPLGLGTLAGNLHASEVLVPGSEPQCSNPTCSYTS